LVDKSHSLSDPVTVTEETSNLALLSAQGLSKSFGGIQAVQNVSLEVKLGSITGLIGPNGAGKTTLFNLLSNFITPDSGKIEFDGKPIQKLRSHRIAQRGLVRTFQVARVLSRLSVLENMLLGAQKQTGENLLQVLIQPRRVQREEKQQRDRALLLLESVGLADKAYEYAGALSGGQRKLLELARAMMTHPKLILLDEPAAGVNPILINQISDHVLQWNEEGITFLIIEHNMDVIMSLCQEIWVLAEGTNLAHGTPEEIQGNSEVLEAYLGQ